MPLTYSLEAEHLYHSHFESTVQSVVKHQYLAVATGHIKTLSLPNL